MIRVFVVDDHHLVRDGLTALLDRYDDIALAGEASDGAAAVQHLVDEPADVVLMDLSMPGMGGVEATREIVAVSPDTRVLVLTTFSDQQLVLDAIDAGAVGYLLKDSSPEQVVEGVRAAARGESPLDPKAAGALLRARADRRPAVSLTAREREVLTLLGEGLLNKQIARRLGISEKTVKTHLTSIFATIGVQDRVGAALWARRNGFAADGFPTSPPGP